MYYVYVYVYAYVYVFECVSMLPFWLGHLGKPILGACSWKNEHGNLGNKTKKDMF